MIRRSNSILIAILLLQSTWVFGQVDFQFSQYIFNPYIVNPAYAGSHEALEVSSSFRKQWFGVEGSPFSQVISAHSPLANKKVGLGLAIAHDKIGVHNNIQMTTSYAYKIKIDRNKHLSIGLQGGFYQSMSNYDEVIASLQNNSDPVFNENIPQNLNATFGSGLFYHTKDFYFGFSILNMETEKVFENAQSFLTAGKTLKLSNDVVFQPSILIKSTNNRDFSADIVSNVVLNDVLWLGLSYRTFSSINILTQLQLTPQIRFGYSYDAPSRGMGKISAGTHEIMLKYRFSFYRARVITPRYF